jgi:2-polyprenyl-3-methyl-5-hydroxy-6-metoxy-1,4-benzoquinol methylase
MGITQADIRERINQYPWYHAVQVTEDIATPGLHHHPGLIGMTLAHLRRLDLRGKRFLDIGCRDGFFCFEAEKLGAAEVVGIDNDLSRGAVELLVPLLRSKVRMHQMNVLDLRPETFGKFDVVLCAGVLYHLRYPFWSLKLIRDVIKEDGNLLLETAVLVDDNRRALLFCPIGADSPYEGTSCTFYNTKALTETLGSLGLEVNQVTCLNPDCWSRPPAETVIDRAALVCRHSSQMTNPRLTAYWDGIHHMHTIG